MRSADNMNTDADALNGTEAHLRQNTSVREKRKKMPIAQVISNAPSYLARFRRLLLTQLVSTKTVQRFEHACWILRVRERSVLDRKWCCGAEEGCRIGREAVGHLSEI